MGYVVKEDGLKKINFYIYKDLQVEEIICQAMINFKMHSFVPGTILCSPRSRYLLHGYQPVRVFGENL